MFCLQEDYEVIYYVSIYKMLVEHWRVAIARNFTSYFVEIFIRLSVYPSILSQKHFDITFLLSNC